MSLGVVLRTGVCEGLEDTVSFLTTRVREPTEEDEKKLIKVLKYLYGSLDLTLTLTGSEDMIVTAYIDCCCAIAQRGKLLRSGGNVIVMRGMTS
jgi:hypothetical protein